MPDVGVAGVLRLLSRLEEIERADVVIAVAGMEASLFSVLGGLVGRPIIAVPTSRGYGAAFQGLASLLSAVNSCANGVTAVNIDSGYAAAMAAYRILSGGPRRWDRKDRSAPTARASTSTPRRVGVDRKRKKALLGRATTPVKLSASPRPSRSCSTPTATRRSRRARSARPRGVFEAMLRDRKRPTILLGLAGSLIAAGMRQVIVDLIEQNMVDVVVSTGAIISQDYYQVRGGRHYHGHPDADDKELRDLYIDRLYDTFIDEEKYWETDLAVSKFADALAGQDAVLARRSWRCSRELAQRRQGLDPRRLRAQRRAALRAGLERLLDRHRPDRALPPRPQGGEDALPDQLDRATTTSSRRSS